MGVLYCSQRDSSRSSAVLEEMFSDTTSFNITSLTLFGSSEEIINQLRLLSVQYCD